MCLLVTDASLVIAARTVLCAALATLAIVLRRRTAWLLRWPYDDPVSTSSLRPLLMSSMRE